MSDLALDLTTGDLALASGRLSLVTGAAAVRQKLLIRLRLWLGEWVLDRRVGVPYLRDVLVKAPDRAVVEGLLRSVILTCPGVAALLTFELVLRSDRSALLSFDAQPANDDAVIEVRDFVVGGA